LELFHPVSFFNDEGNMYRSHGSKVRWYVLKSWSLENESKLEIKTEA